jgi:integrase
MRNQNFSALVEDYLAMRHSLGFDIERIRWLLRDFVHFIGRIEHRGPITVDLAARWALSSHSSDPARAERRLWAVRQFARHLAAFDPDTEIPPAGLFGRVTRRSRPHIYSDAEITALLQECSRLQPCDGLRPKTYVALFSLLASTCQFQIFWPHRFQKFWPHEGGPEWTRIVAEFPSRWGRFAALN